MKRPRTDPYLTDRELDAELLRLAKRTNPADPRKNLFRALVDSNLDGKTNLRDSDIEAAEMSLIDFADAVYAIAEQSIEYAKGN